VATELEKSDRNIETNDVASALVHMRHTVGVNVNDLDNRTDSTEVPRKKAKVVVEEMSLLVFPQTPALFTILVFFKTLKSIVLLFEYSKLARSPKKKEEKEN